MTSEMQLKQTRGEFTWRQRYRLRRLRAALVQVRWRAVGVVRRNRVRVYWWNRLINFGDLITPELVKAGGRVPEWSPGESAQLVGAGSVLQWLPSSFRGVVFGSGLIAPEGAHNLPKAEIIAVRGRLTAAAINCRSDVLLGDPGLLVRRLSPRRVERDRILGLVPHYLDRRAPAVRCLAERFCDEALWIDVQRPAAGVVRAIDRCELVISSSLHGLVVADALGIPSIWARFSGELVGGTFKFDDYYSALDTSRAPAEITGRESLESLREMAAVPSAMVQQRAERLEAAWTEILSRLEGR